MNLNLIQEALNDAKLAGWLFYDHHNRDPIAYRILGIEAKMCTRRWYYLIPQDGEPLKLVHRIERASLEGLPGIELVYSSWDEQRTQLKKLLEGKKQVAMQYSPFNDIPNVGLVDAGTIELVRSLGTEVTSSADLVQMFEARWSPQALALHLEAGKAVHTIIREAFAMIGQAVKSGKSITEYDVQTEMVRKCDAYHLMTSDPSIVAVNANTTNPHYNPASDTALPIRENDLVLLDLWAKRRAEGSVYFDITWMGFVAQSIPRRYEQIFDVVREARDRAVEFVRTAVQRGQTVFAYEVDDIARGVIADRGYPHCVVHRTGHSIGEDVHGNGANLDNFETHDYRRLISRTCFSVEPGIYLEDFGLRSEVDVFVDERDAWVTGEIQESIVPILAATD